MQQLTPEIVPAMAQAVATVQRGALDLRRFQKDLYRRQRARRLKNIASEARKHMVRKHRTRVRLPLLKDSPAVLDTRTSSRGQLYFELGNGQIVRADKVAVTRPNGSTKITNPVIVQIVASEITKNLRREAA